MDIIRLCAWGYAALLGFVILTGYIPAFIDQNDMIFGLFRRTWYADGLHLVSALWAPRHVHLAPRLRTVLPAVRRILFRRRRARASYRQRLSRLRHPHQRHPQPAAVDAVLCQRAASGPWRRRDPIGYLLAPRTRATSMLRRLRRFLAVLAILIALSVLVAAGLYRGPCGPVCRAASVAPHRR